MCSSPNISWEFLHITHQEATQFFIMGAKHPAIWIYCDLFTPASNNIWVVLHFQLPGQGVADAYLLFPSASGTHRPWHPTFLAGTWTVFPEAETKEAGWCPFEGYLGCGGLWTLILFTFEKCLLCSDTLWTCSWWIWPEAKVPEEAASNFQASWAIKGRGPARLHRTIQLWFHGVACSSLVLVYDTCLQGEL